ncbi:MAG: hypothetical protein IT454_07590 [Planctomycetes bacterium]|nr:hypothetical protein [Planctomycetota bacterium]
MQPPANAVRASGECRVLFAFDVAQSIDLVRAAQTIHEPSTLGALGQAHEAPSGFQFTPPPLRVRHRAAALSISRWSASESVELVLFDFGAVVVSYTLPFDGTLRDCIALACELAQDTSLARAARLRVDELVAALGAHLVKGGVSDVVEDYAVFRLPGALLERDAERFVTAHAAELTGILRAEDEALSRDVIADALAVRVQYGPSDLALIDWRHAVVFDDAPEDALRVLEYANVQLLELRFLDAQLDTALDASLRSVSRHGQRRHLGPMALRRELRQLSTMQLEAAFLFERLGNTLKISSDQHLARLLRQANARFRLQEWNDTAQRKLAALDNVYDKLHDHAATVRAEVLEILIVLLIVFEIALSLIEH